MQLFDMGSDAVGVIAIGQNATGVVAIGQYATGVIAIGLIARGIFALGLVAFGLVAVGAAGAGVFYAKALLGIGGRGSGYVLRLIPRLQERFDTPEETDLATLQSGRAPRGWLKATLNEVGGVPALVAAGQPLNVRFARELVDAARQEASLGTKEVLAQLDHLEGGLVCTRLMGTASAYAKPTSKIFAVLKLFLLLILCVLFWVFVAYPLLLSFGAL